MGFLLLLALSAPQESDFVVRKGPVEVKLRERGAHLADGFGAEKIDTERWRIWESNPGQVKFLVRDGRFVIKGKNRLR